MPPSLRTPIDDEEELLAPRPAAPKADVNGITTGAVTTRPTPQSAAQETQAAPAPIQWSEDPAQRVIQTRDEVARRKEAIYRQKNPLAPSDWAGSLTADDWAGGKTPGPAPGIRRRPDRTVDNQVQDEAAYGIQQQREQEVATRRAALAAQKADIASFNSAALAKYKANGQQYYEDPASGKLVETVDDRGRKLYHATDWEVGQHPQTGLPAMAKRDRFGQRQFKRPTLALPTNPEDDYLYADMGDGDSQPYMKASEAAASNDASLARLGLQHITRKNTALRRAAFAPAKAAANAADLEVSTAQSTADRLDSELQELYTKGDDPKVAPEIQAKATQLQAIKDSLKFGGDLHGKQKQAKMGMKLVAATAARDSYVDQEREITARLRAEGVDDPENDPTFIANREHMAMASQAVDAAKKESATYAELMAKRAQPVAPAEAPPAENPNGGDLAQTGKAFARGATSEGIYAAGEGAARVFASSPMQRAIEAGQDKITELVQGFPLTDKQKADRAQRRADDRKGTLAEGADAAVAGYAEQTARLRDTLRKALPVDQKFMESKLGQIAQGVGQAAGTLPAAALGAPAMAAASIGQIYDEGFQDAKQAGQDDATAHRTAMKYLPAAGLDYLSERLIVGKLMKPLVGKTTVGQVLKDIVATAATEGGTEGAQQLYLNQIAKNLEGYDPQRPFDKEVLDSMIVGAVVGGGVTATGAAAKAVLPRGSEPTAGPSDPGVAPAPAPTGTPVDTNVAPVGADQTQFADSTVYPTAEAATRRQPTPEILNRLAALSETAAAGSPEEQAAANAELERMVAEFQGPNAAPIDPAAPKSAEESAQVFAPELAERANIPPPFKPAAESADVFQQDEANTQALGRQEAAAQSPVDQVQEVSGKSRDEILATRAGKDIGQWSQELQRDAEYYANPIGVDPERRSAELRTEIEQLDQNWNQNIRQLIGETEVAQRKEVLAQARADLAERKQAIEDELGRIDQIRQSPQGAAGLTEQLSQEEQASAEDARRLRTPDLEGRRDAIEQQLTEAERLRQSPQGGEALRQQLSNETQTQETVAAGNPAEERTALDTQERQQSQSEQLQPEQGNDAAAVEQRGEGDRGQVGESVAAPAEAGQRLLPETRSEPVAATESGAKPLPPTWQVTVQEKQGDVPGYVQVDKLGPNGENEGSVSPEQLRAEGYDVPDLSQVKQGRYTAEELQGAMEAPAKSAPAEKPAPKAKKKQAPVVERAARETVTPAEDTVIGKNRAGETLRERADGSVYRMRFDRPNTAPNGYPDFGGDLSQVEEAPALTPPKDAAPISADTPEATPETVTGDPAGKGWTQFAPESGTLGVPRSEMPQIASDKRGALINFLKARDITAKGTMVNPAQLKPTQAEFSPSKVQQAREYRGNERPILISSDGHIVDGHHQWMASLDDDTPMAVIKLNAPIDKVLAEMKEFPSAENASGAAKTATPEPSVSAKPEATARLGDRALAALKAEQAKILKRNAGKVGANNLHDAAYYAALQLAELAVRAGRAVDDVVRLAVTRYKAKHAEHTDQQLAEVEQGVRTALQSRPPEPKPGTAKSRVPESLKEVGVPAESVEYDVRAQNDRMKEAREMVNKDATKAEADISNVNLPSDTRVALGGQLVADKMEAMKNADPADVMRLTREIQRITEATSKVGTSAGQGSSMFNKIYQNIAVGNAMEYVKDVQKKRLEKLGGAEAQEAAKAAADALNAAKTPEEKAKAIEKLRERFTTAPVRRMLDQLKRAEVAKELNRLGVLTSSDLTEVAGNALGIPGIEQSKLKRIAELADAVDKAKTHAEKSRAQLALVDTLGIYKGVSALDTEASILTLNILSGPSTQAANLEGNALNLITQLATTAAVNPSRIGAIMEGVKQGIPLGWDQAKSIMKTGRGTTDFQDRTLGAGQTLSNIDYARDFPKLNPTVGKVLTARARAVDYIARGMKAADSIFYYPGREAYAHLVATKLLEGEYSGAELKQKVSETLHTTPEAFESARKQGEAEGYEGVDLGRRVADIIEERRKGTTVGTEAAKQGGRFGAETTFNNEPVGLAGVIYRNLARTVKDADIGGVPVLKPWAMFLRVPSNVFNTTTNFTPMGALRAYNGVKGENYRKGRTGEGQWRNYTADEQRKLYLQSVIGTTLMGGLVAKALKDDDVEITASGPNDGAKRAQLKNAGWNPYSIKVDNKWISYKDSPLLVPLAIVGHVADAVRYQKSKSDMVLENKVTDAIASAPQIIFQTSMLSGLSDLMAGLSGKGDLSSAASRTLGSVPANLAIPYNRLLQQIDQTFDDKTYKTNAAVDAVPFARRTGTPQTDVQGRPQTYSPMDRFGTMESTDKVDALLRDKGVFIPDIAKDTKLGDRVMTPEEHDKYRKLSGQRIRVRVQAMAPALKGMTKEKAQDEIDSIADEERKNVKRLIGPAIKKK